MKCLICNKEFKSLNGLILHLRSHGISRQEYYDQFFKGENEGFCLVCGKQTKFIRGVYSKYCRGCSNKDPNIKEKKKKTVLKHFGYESPLQSKSVRDRVKKTCIERYGVENPTQSNAVQDKIKSTCIKRYGVENVFQSQIIQAKFRNTCNERYGVDNPFSSSIIKDKIKQSYLNKYGVENPMLLEKVKRKHKLSCIDHYGVDNPSRSEIIKDRKKETCLLNWGSEYFVSSDDGRQMAREFAIKRVKDQINNDEPGMPNIGIMERSCLNELQKYTDFKIIRNPQLIGYFPDGYILELCIVIEFDERHHFIDDYETYSEYDIQKDEDYTKNNFLIFRIKKRDWEQTKNNIIEKFKEFINAK